MKKLELKQMEKIEGGGFWGCLTVMVGGMIGGAGTGSMIGSGFMPGFGTAIGAAVGLYFGGIGAALSSDRC